MNPNQQIGKMLIIGGIIVLVIGIAFLYSNKIPFLGRLPGDINIRRENFSFHFPIVTSIIISIVISLILYLIRRFS